jgi:hypothetical protein
MENNEIVKPGAPVKTTEVTAIKGTVELVLRDAQGNIKQEQTVQNIITATGLAHMANRISGISSPAAMGWMAIGTGAAAAAVTDTLLGAEIARVALSPAVSLVTTTQANDTIQYQATFGAGVGTGALAEAGVFGVVTANTGPMLNRLVFAVINKGASDALSITWKVKVA